MIKCESTLSAKQKDRQTSRKAVTQGGRPGMGRQLHFALQPSSTMRKCASAPKGQSVRGYGEVYGSSFSGNYDRLALEKGQVKA